MRSLPTRRIITLGLLALASTLLVHGVVRAQDNLLAGCTEASLKGPYAYSRTGTVVRRGPAAANGVVTFDGQGNLAGTDTASLNGTVTARDFKGEYAVAPDCTGKAIFVFTDQEVVNIDLQVVASKQEVQFIQTDAGTVIVGIAKAQGPRPGLLAEADAEDVQALGGKISPACEQESLGGGGSKITCTAGDKVCTCVYPKGQAAYCTCQGIRP